jgi:hypothetical protein
MTLGSPSVAASPQVCGCHQLLWYSYLSCSSSGAMLSLHVGWQAARAYVRVYYNLITRRTEWFLIVLIKHDSLQDGLHDS